MQKCSLLILLLLFVRLCAVAQETDVSKYKQQYQLHIHKTATTIKIDGNLEEASWQQAGTADNFWQKFPKDDIKATRKTEIRVLYDDNFLYFGLTAWDTLPFIGQSLKRDSRIRESDGIGIMLDPMNKKTSGFYFTVTAFNVQADDLLSNGSGGELSFSWDNKWYSDVQRFNDHYTIEMAIPFKALRYDKTSTVWGINFIRSDKKNNEFNTWTRVPLNFPSYDLGYLGALIWDAPPPKPGNNITLIPYITGNTTENRKDNIGVKADAAAGIDAKVALTSSLNLDLTVNPDFSQVEVDRQVTNLSRFNIFFPERRNFFLENSDLFAEYGIPPIRPFYSRRIGLDPDGNTIPIAYGIRLTGNAAPRTRIGLLDMQTKATAGYARQNYSAVTMQQQVLKRSTFKAYVFNRQGQFDDQHTLSNPLDKYGRNAGGEFYFVNSKGDWQGWVGYHHAMKPGIDKNNNYLNYGGGYFGRNISSFINVDNAGTNFYTDMGFVQRIENYDALNDTIIRLGFHSLYNDNSYTIYPKTGKVNLHVFRLTNGFTQNPDHSLNERNISFSYAVENKNTSGVDFRLINNETRLLYHTSFTDGDPLPPGRYHYTQAGVHFRTDSRKKISFENGITAGHYFSGNYLEYTASFIYRHQPWLTIQMNAVYNKLEFAAPYGKANLFLLAPRVEVNFSNKLFWTTFLQYNTQRNNININSRLQWRYKPASDLFLVYTDNYFSDPFLKSKNRAFVFKMNYWLNL